MVLFSPCHLGTFGAFRLWELCQGQGGAVGLCTAVPPHYALCFCRVGEAGTAMWPGPWCSDLGMEAQDQVTPCPFPGAAPGKPLTPELTLGGQSDTGTLLCLSTSLSPGPLGSVGRAGLRREEGPAAVKPEKAWLGRDLEKGVEVDDSWRQSGSHRFQGLQWGRASVERAVRELTEPWLGWLPRGLPLSSL